MGENDIGHLVDEFRKVAISYGAAIAEGAVRASNRSTDRLEKLDRELAKRGGEAALLDLLYDENQWVQVCAAIAMLMLEFAQETAMQTLRQIAAEGKPLPSLEAQMALLGWSSGDFQSCADAMAEERVPEQTTPAPRDEVDRSTAVKEILARARKIPRTVRFTDIRQLETMEDRFFAVDRIVGDIVGMNVDSVEFCPNHQPPSQDEVLAWLWVIHPEYRAGILELGSGTIRTAVLESEPE